MRAIFNKTWLCRVGLSAALLNAGAVHAQDVGTPPALTDANAALTQSFQAPMDANVAPFEGSTAHAVDAPIENHLKVSELKPDVSPTLDSVKSSQAYSWKAAEEDLKSIKWEAAGTFAGITAIGVKSWKWGSSSFHFNSEHWFGKKNGFWWHR